MANYYYLAINPNGVVNLDDFCILSVPKRFKNHRSLTNENSFQNSQAYKLINSTTYQDVIKNTHYLVGPLETKQGIIRELNVSLKWFRAKRKEEKKALHQEQKELPRKIKRYLKTIKALIDNIDFNDSDIVLKIERPLQDACACKNQLDRVNSRLKQLKPARDLLSEFALKGISSATYEQFSQKILPLHESKAFKEGWFIEYRTQYGRLVSEEF